MEERTEELLELVAELAGKYAGYESTSLPWEKARSLMEAVLYCIDEYANGCGDGLVPKEISLREQYETGVELLREKVAEIRTVFNEMTVRFEDFGVKCLHDTVQRGIPHFLKWYDIRFCPQDMILMPDYPLLGDFGDMRGADAVYRYIRAVKTEQIFLGALGKRYVTAVLREYNPDYQEMCENICDVVLTDLVKRIALQKPFGEAGFSEEECLELSAIFAGKSVDELEKTVTGLIRKTVERFYGNNGEMADYLCLGARDTAAALMRRLPDGEIRQ